MTAVRRAAVAGSFYPADPERLARTVDGLLAQAPARPGPPPLAMIQPHAGYEYSGPVAATGYRRLADTRPAVRRVVVLAPNHTLPLDTIALGRADIWNTPLGPVPVDTGLRSDLACLDRIEIDSGPHRREHAIEVHLPFLVRVLEPGWALLPVVVGTVPDAAAAALIDRCLLDPDTLVIASSDLSHHLPYDAATARDRDTVDCIVSRDPDGIGPNDACGRHPVRGLLASHAAAAWTPEVLDLRNSGDTAGDRHAVVGYTSIVFC